MAMCLYCPFLSYVNSFMSLRADYEDQLQHDFALHKVFLYLCPTQESLLCTIQKSPPLIGISFVIDKYKDTQKISDSEVWCAFQFSGYLMFGL